MRTVTSWQICMDYQKLNAAMKKDHFPLPFIDQVLDQLTGNDYFCFLDGYVRLQPDNDRTRRPIKVHIHLLIQTVCFSSHAVWFMQCTEHVSEVHDGNLLRVSRGFSRNLMDDFSVYRQTYEVCLKNFERILKRCEETNLC
ncbi:uncharacterized protein LOC120073417 [Benincasa hispida]|uniref:uncharacterized protein LOC120073417 n=1 Tax=Benincasa hispida TaxID=102211 RepID=UPI0018FF166C|nr:uncharacterized protein LOC120073417 [Benincasa hispida]